MGVLIGRLWREPVLFLTVVAIVLDAILIGPFGLPPGVVAIVHTLQAALTRALVTPTRPGR